MKTTVAEKTNQIQWLLRRLDMLLFAVLLLVLAGIVVSSGMANIQTDAIDYYAILQRLTQNSGSPIVQNLHFVDQRSPGYPILALIPYHILSVLVDPFVQTQEIQSTGDTSQQPTPPPPPSQPSGAQPQQPPQPPSGAPSGQAPTERMLLPSQSLLFKDIFFRNYYIPQQSSWFEWKLIAALLLTGYGFLFAGLVVIAKMLHLEKRAFAGISLAPLVVFTSSVFMHNVVLTPAYATLTAFGISCLFAYCFVRGFQDNKRLPQLLAGVFGGLLVLTRLETVLIAGVVVLALAVMREFRYLRHYILGGLVAVVILIGYNVSQFGTPFYTGILKGDINELTFNGSYIIASLVSPQAGIVFWSTLTTLGIIGLFLDKRRYTRILGFASLALIALVLVRVPVMYLCIGEGTRLIGGLPVSCLNDTSDALMLIQSDTNRYITVLIPFAVIGLRTWIAYLPRVARRLGVRIGDA